jgi:Na+/H+ antiporter NhaC
MSGNEEFFLKEKIGTMNKKLIGNVIFGIIMLIIIISFIIKMPSTENLGWYTLVPSLFAIVYIFYAKDVLTAYLVAGLLGTFFMSQNKGFVMDYFWRMYDTAMSEAYIWLVIVCGMMGSIIVLIQKTGGATAFSRWISRFIRTRKSSMLCTFGLGAVVFTDDYLNSLAVGPSMSYITDEKRVSREMLSYIVDTMAAAPCVLIPISTWAAFVGSVFEVNGIAPTGEGVKYFIKTIPYSFYAMFAILVCFLVIIGVIPLFGKMKVAELRAQNEGILAPQGSEKVSMEAIDEYELPDNPKVMNLFVPLVVLVATTVMFDMDMFVGCVLTLIFCFFFYLAQKLVTVSKFMDCIVEGFKSMIFLFVLVCLSYSFTATLTELGFASFIVDQASGIMTPTLMPLIIFLIFGATEFMTGTNWDLYMLMLPVVVPLSEALGGNTILCAAALISAGVWGSHVCPASDATVCTSAACGCDNYAHSITQMPYAFIAFVLSAIAYLIAGILL